MVNLYTEEVRKFIYSHKAELPKGLIIDTIEYDDHLALRLYRDNFDALDGVDRLRVTKVLHEVVAGIWAFGCPCTVEAEQHVPK